MNISALSFKRSFLRNTKIQGRIMAAFLLLSIIPLLALGVIAVKLSSSAVEDKIESYSYELLKATSDFLNLKTLQYLEMNKEVILSDLIQKDVLILDDMDRFQKNQTIQSIERYLTNKFIKDENIICSIIMSEDKAFKYGSTNFLPQDKWNEIYSMTVEYGGGAKDFKTLCLSVNLGNSNAVIYCNNITSALSDEQIGVMATVIDEKYLFEGYRDVQIAEGSHIYVIDSGGTIISSVNHEEVGQAVTDNKLIGEVIQSAQDNQSFHYGNNLVSSKILEPSKWYLVSEIPYSYLYRESNIIRNYVIISIIICFALCLIVALFTTKSITTPLNNLVKVMKRAEDGDLTLYVNDTNKDEVAVLFNSFNQMIGNIKHLILKVQTSAKQVKDGASEVSTSASESFVFSQQMADAMQQIADGTINQAANTADGVRHMESLSGDIIEVKDIMTGVLESLENTKTINERIQNNIILLNDKAVETSEITKKVVGDITELNTNMKDIGTITKLIKSVAEQTKLLSLNAAIEAAKAGEAGRSFAVVAEEVKKLSDKSMDASKAISSILDGIRVKTMETATQANSAILTVNEQTEAVCVANDSFKVIFENIKNIISLLGRMSQFVNKMIASRDKTSGAIENISSVAQEFAATAEEVAASAEGHIDNSRDLSELAGQLSELAIGLANSIANFKIN